MSFLCRQFGLKGWSYLLLVVDQIGLVGSIDSLHYCLYMLLPNTETKAPMIMFRSSSF